MRQSGVGGRTAVGLAVVCAVVAAGIAAGEAQAATPSFGNVVVTAVGHGPNQIAVADFNNDGRPDAVVADGAVNASTITVLIGNGAGSFARHDYGPFPLVYTPSGTPQITSVATGDLNGDGNADIVFNTFQGEYEGVLLGNGDGTFQPVRTINIQPLDQAIPTAVAVGDMNGDGKPDLVITRTWPQGAVQILPGNGDGTFTRGSRIASGGQKPDGLTLADMNGDGNLDAVVANYDTNGNGQNVSVLFGDGRGGWAGSETYSVTNMQGGNIAIAHPVTVGDLNGDGYPDVSVGTTTGGSATVLYGSASGALTAASIDLRFGAAPWDVAFADMNADDIPDVVTADRSTIYALTGTGGGSFGAATGRLELYPSTPTWLAVADFNGDGLPDVLVANPSADTVSFVPNATVLDSTPPQLTVPSNLTVDADSPAGAAVQYSVSAVDAVDGPVAATCSPESGTPFPIGTSTVTCSAADKAGNSATASFTVTVRSPAEQLARLQTQVAGVGPGRSLVQKVAGANTKLAAGDSAGAVAALSDFEHEVQAQTGKKLDAATAADLLAAAERIRAALGY